MDKGAFAARVAACERKLCRVARTMLREDAGMEGCLYPNQYWDGIAPDTFSHIDDSLTQTT